MKIDIKKWNAERIETEAAIKKLWTTIKARFNSGMSYAEYSELNQLTRKATKLYKIRAFARGKQHQKVRWVPKYASGINLWERQVVTAEEEAEEIKADLPRYLLPETVAA